MHATQLNALFAYYLNTQSKPLKKQGCFTWYQGFYVVTNRFDISVHVVHAISKYVLKCDLETNTVSIVYK